MNTPPADADSLAEALAAVGGHSVVFLGSGGLMDALEPEAGKGLAERQADDVSALGPLLLQQASKSMAAHAYSRKSLDFVASQYSRACPFLARHARCSAVCRALL